jgi:hypothetical protein
MIRTSEQNIKLIEQRMELNVGILPRALDLLQADNPQWEQDTFLALVDHFKQDTTSAEIYVALKQPALRLGWAQKQLEMMGYIVDQSAA